MPPSGRDKVLNCATLPSLPGVAMKVLELTRDPNVSVNKIAEAVQNDPALATKVLRTVNSSFYGLTTPCPSISRAMALLGMTTVKSIVLSFSLVDFSKKMGLDSSFDMSAYWRRAMFTAAGARAFALKTRLGDPEEAFIGALISDIGVLAACTALKDEYLNVLASGPDDHDELAAHEQKVLGFQHASLGSDLARRWKLPEQLVAAVEHHHTPDDAPPEHARLVRAVNLGAMAAAALTVDDPKRKLARLVVDAKRWFGLEPDVARSIVQQTAKDAKALAKLLDLNTGEAPDADSILAQAQDQMLEAQMLAQAEAQKLRETADALTKRTITDALTGASNRAHFDAEISRMFGESASSGSPLAVIFADADRFKSINDTLGHQAGDAVLVELAKRLRDTIGEAGQVFRYGGEEFVIALPGLAMDDAIEFAEMIRTAVEARPVNLRARGVDADDRPITISLGVAVSGQPGPKTAEALVHLADEAVYAAKKAGRNRVFKSGTSGPEPANSHAAAPAPAPATAQTTAPAEPGAKAPARPMTPATPALSHGTPTLPTTVLVIEDDPFAAKLLGLVLAKRPDLKAVFAVNAEDAIKLISTSGPGQVRPGLIICDNQLPGMSGLEFIKSAKADRRMASVPVIMMTATPDASFHDEARQAGASMSLTKADFCLKFEQYMNDITKLARTANAA